MAEGTTTPTAGLVIIGAEVLSGKVRDENGPYLIEQLRARGIEVVEIRTIGDLVEAISKAVRELSERLTFVFTTGGIGPTHDDVTVAGVAAAFGRRVVRDPSLIELLEKGFGGALARAKHKMAEIPEGACVLRTGKGFPVLQIANVTLLPGVPTYLKNCFSALDLGEHAPFISQALFLAAAESAIAGHLAAVQERFADVQIGSYPNTGGAAYRVKVTLDGRQEARVEQAKQALLDGFEPSWLVRAEPPASCGNR